MVKDLPGIREALGSAQIGDQGSEPSNPPWKRLTLGLSEKCSWAHEGPVLSAALLPQHPPTWADVSGLAFTQYMGLGDSRDGSASTSQRVKKSGKPRATNGEKTWKGDEPHYYSENSAAA